MSDITIPPEVVEAADAAFRNYEDYDHAGAIRAAITAALKAWPGSYTDDEIMYGKVIGKTIFLPLPSIEGEKP